MINLAEEVKKTSDDLYADWEDKEAAAYEQIETPMEMRKFEIEPKAEKTWGDINKDSTLGNLSMSEVLAISMGEEYFTSVVALRAMMPNKVIGKYFFPQSLTEAVYRKKASTLAISNSKDGFLRRILVSRFVHKGYDYSSREEGAKEDQKIIWNPFVRKKKKNDQVLV